jgi:hypothetical protein
MRCPKGLTGYLVGSRTGTGNFMKNVLLISAAVAAALSISWAAYADSQGAFVQANIGRTNANANAKDSSGYGALGGYRWAVDAPFYLGVEGGYMNLSRQTFTARTGVDFVDATGAHTLTGESRIKSKNEALLLGVNGKWELPAQYFITAHAGVARYRNDVQIHSTGTLDGQPTDGSHDHFRYYDTSYYAGVGFGYDFNPQVSLSFNYDHYAPQYEAFGIKDKVKFDAYSAAVEFRF